MERNEGSGHDIVESTMGSMMRDVVFILRDEDMRIRTITIEQSHHFSESSI